MVTREPAHGKWNPKASHTWELILNWADWCTTIKLYNPEYNMLVASLVKHFEVIYTWAFRTVYELVSLHQFQLTVSNFVERWRQVMGGGKNRNYYHWLAVESFLQIMASGSIWKYSSDITESFVHVIKDCYLKYTNRGGKNRSWTRQVMQRILLKVTLKSLSSEEWTDMISPFEKRRFIAEIVKHMLHE